MPLVAAIVTVLELPLHIGDVATTDVAAFCTGLMVTIGFVVSDTLLHPTILAVMFNVSLITAPEAVNVLVLIFKLPVLVAVAVPKILLT